MLLAFAVGAVLAAAPADLTPYPPYDRAVPPPERTLGWQLGERHSTYRDQERALDAIVAASPSRVRVIPYGMSWEKRPLRVLAITSPENLRRLPAIRAELAKAAQGETVDVAKLPVVVWVNQVIHGDETASFESAMALVYNLVASNHPDVERIRREAIVVVNPVYNPDGHERFVTWYNSIAVGSSASGAFEQSDPGLSRGRTNRYRFDMNRDRVAMSQVESRAEVAEFLRWNPQVYIDQHGQTDNYFFPPNPMSINVNVDRERLNKWTDLFGRATAEAFDRQSWTYFVREAFDLYYPGYLDSWVTLSGAIGMTHETDGGRVLAVRRDDGTLLTLRDGLEKHFVSAMAVTRAAVDRRFELLTSWSAFKRRATTGELAGPFQRVLVEARDPRPLQRLADQLARSGIRSQMLEGTLDQPDAVDFWSGAKGARKFGERPTLVIDMAQPQGALAKALLEPKSDFEREFVERQIKRMSGPESERQWPEFYDMTGWALPYLHGLDAWWSSAKPAFKGREPRAGPAPEVPRDEAAVGYAIRYADVDDALAAFDIAASGVNVRVASEPMELSEGSFPAGTFVILAARNEEGYAAKVKAAATRRGAKLVPLRSSYPRSGADAPGSGSVRAIRRPRVGVLFGTSAQPADFGSTWFVLEQVLRVPFTPLTTRAVTSQPGSYSVILAPSPVTVSDALRNWILGGGCLVVLGSPDWALTAFQRLDSAGTDVKPVPGSIFRASWDLRSFLSWGAPRNEVGIFANGSTFYRVRKEGGSVLRTPDSEAGKLLTGWAWPDDTEKALRNAAFVQDIPVGRGRVVVFMADPTERAMWPAFYPALVNAILVGPSGGGGEEADR